MATETLIAQAARVKAAARVVGLAPVGQRNGFLTSAAERIRKAAAGITEANDADLAAAVAHGATPTSLDRLRLTEARLEAMAVGLETVASLGDPLGVVVEGFVRPNGLRVERVRVPLGVIGIIYENRPNVTADAAGLCIKAGNAAFLRGSSAAMGSNRAIVAELRAALVDAGLPGDAISLVEDPSHAVAAEFMGLRGYLDCLVPRGGPALIASMREHAQVPFILDGDGNCHTYIDADADLDMSVEVVTNAKVQRPGVCNATETLLVHASVADQVLPRLDVALASVEFRGCERTRAFVGRATVASEADYAEEFLDLILAVKVVDSIDDAITHIARYSSGHSEAIITSSLRAADRFCREVDAAAVVVNASTRFVDGGELGLGAEIGISTQKLHARGPMGLEAITTVKWILRGEGQVRR